MTPKTTREHIISGALKLVLMGCNIFIARAFKFSICCGDGLLDIPFLVATWLLIISSRVKFAESFIILFFGTTPTSFTKDFIY